MDFCKLRNEDGPIGPYAIRLPTKAREALAARDFSLFLIHRMNWVEDGLRVVIGVMLSGKGKVSDYLRLTYPETFAEVERKTEINETRRTLLFRLRYLLRCMGIVAEHYTEFRQWSFSGLGISLEVFAECVRQAAGEKVGERLRKSIDRFARLWRTVDFDLSSAEAVRRELQILVDDLDEVFEILREAFRAREEDREREAAKGEQTASELAALCTVQAAANREHQRALRRCEELSAAQRTGGTDDPYSALAGLEGLPASRRKELIACFRYSHEKFPIDRNAKGSLHTLRHLAELVWRQNEEEFAALARLKEKPGYKDARSLASKLYKLAKQYPAADHFAWRDTKSAPRNGRFMV